MMSRTLRRSLLDVRIPITSLPPTFLLPLRARFFNSTPQIIEPATDGSSQLSQPPLSSKPIIPTSPSAQISPLPSPPPSSSATESTTTALPPANLPPLHLSPSTLTLLPLLLSQPSHYITLHIHARPYLVTPGDTIRLPFAMRSVSPGDVLRLNRASAIGSRDYTLKGAPYIDERLFECRATVIATDAEPVRVVVKKKRRNRRTKTVRSKHRFTVVRISEVRVKGLEEIERETEMALEG